MDSQWFAHGKQLLAGTPFDCTVVAEFVKQGDAEFAARACNWWKRNVENQTAPAAQVSRPLDGVSGLG